MSAGCRAGNGSDDKDDIQLTADAPTKVAVKIIGAASAVPPETEISCIALELSIISQRSCSFSLSLFATTESTEAAMSA